MELSSVELSASPEVRRLWEIADGAGASEIDAACQRVCETLAELVGARCSSFLLAREEPQQKRWRALRVVRFGPDVARRTRAGDALLRRFNDGLTEPGTRNILAKAGQHRAATRADLYTDDEWASSHARTLKEATHLGDRLVGVCSLGKTVEVFFLFDGPPDGPSFTLEQRRLVASAMPGFVRICRWFALSHGATEDCALLSPSERRLLFELLGPRSEKEIAAALSLSPNYAHQLVVSVYRKMAVSSRPELSALWLAATRPAARRRMR